MEGTMHWAIQQANNLPGLDVIDLSPLGEDAVLEFVKGFKITESLEIQGRNTLIRFIEPGTKFGFIVEDEAGTVATFSWVRIERISDYPGRAIWVRPNARAHVLSSEIRGWSGGFQLGWHGGAVYVEGDFEAENCVLEANSSEGLGGAIYGAPGARVSLIYSLLAKNTSAGHGGAVALVEPNDWHVTRSTFIENEASLWGGALYVEQTSPTWERTIIISTFSQNVASVGAAVANIGAPVEVQSSTFYANHSHQSHPWIYSSVPLVRLTGNLVHWTANSGGATFSCPDVLSGGYNLRVSYAGYTCSLSAPAAWDVYAGWGSEAWLGVDPLPSANVNYYNLPWNFHRWRLMPTHSLLPGSPARDLVPASGCYSTRVTADQRGLPVVNGACDAGAVEYPF